MDTNLDAIDLTLLSALQADARTSLETLADVSGVSVPTVQRRVKQLRRDGVIDREVAIIAPDKLESMMTFIILVEMERERLDILDEFRTRLRDEPNVQQAYYVTGDADFVLICLARNMAEFEQLTQRLFFSNTNIRRFRTSVGLQRTKVGMELPIRESE